MSKLGSTRFAQMQKTVLRMPDILALLGISKATLYRMVEEGRFPAPFKIGKRLNGWRLTDIQAWEANQ